MKTLTATKAFVQVQHDAEKIKNDETATVGTMSLGDVVRQGDLYLIAIPCLPATRKQHDGRQLAPGTTQGSRHVALTGEIFDCSVEEVILLIRSALPEALVHPALIGPCVLGAVAIELDHPEHGNRILPPGAYAVVYQRQFTEEARRVLD